MPEPEEKPVDISSLRLGIKQVIAVIVVIVTILGSGYATYYGVTNRMTRIDATLEQQTKQIEKLTTTNDELKQSVLELKITLKAKGVIQ
jgi:hypothetical protein